MSILDLMFDVMTMFISKLQGKDKDKDKTVVHFFVLVAYQCSLLSSRFQMLQRMVGGE